jgi:hypothetical protein
VKWPRIERGAAEDIDQALSYFAKVDAALEADFAKTLKNALERIAKAPERFARLETRPIATFAAPSFGVLTISLSTSSTTKFRSSTLSCTPPARLLAVARTGMTWRPLEWESRIGLRFAAWL